MLNGFEDITAQLTKEEMAYVPLMLRGFETKVGKANAVTSKEIISRLKERGIELSEARVRKLINHIRHYHLPNLVANSHGYYLTTDYLTLKDYYESLEGREQAIRSLKNNLKQYIDKLNTGTQFKLGL